jgi:alanine-glyoxylate transaminase/serine-glyoxylate transaminase/serine-pyruvate transaminase
LIANTGIWGERAMEMARRQGGDVRELSKPAGETFTLEEIGKALTAHQPVFFFTTHVESSTGAVQGLEGIGPLCASNNCLFVVDSVASLGGVPIRVDEMGIDVIYTGSQKVLAVPPGLAPISFSEKAMKRIAARKTPPISYYLDINMLGKYWNCFEGQNARFYHHTGPINLIYGLREGLAMVAEEGLDVCWERHRMAGQKLHEGNVT